MKLVEDDAKTPAAPATAPAVAGDAATHVDASDLRQVLKLGDVFDALLALHLEGQHCKARTFKARIDSKYARIPRWISDLFVEKCPVCTQRLPRKAAAAGSKPILTEGFGRRGQVDLVDMQTCKDGDLCYLLNYQAPPPHSTCLSHCIRCQRCIPSTG